MLPFGVTIPATVPQGSEIPEGLMNNPVLLGLLFVVLRSILVLVVVESRWTRLTVFKNSVVCSNLASHCPGVIFGSLIKVKVTFLQINVFPASYKTHPLAGKASLPI